MALYLFIAPLIRFLLVDRRLAKNEWCLRSPILDHRSFRLFLREAPLRSTEGRCTDTHDELGTPGRPLAHVDVVVDAEQRGAGEASIFEVHLEHEDHLFAGPQ
ncbi:hypothetical protein BIW11_09608 [Tropilaelaps mercedesae]|uniref:Secreted protein n=1 Tax=Tropilaelaps mercedesae TaxID=418985 RepID=A0A1V9XJS2_9ACAR|nr:hypothetical protein BIW11_09608 [Tropilaelaps mercedesae]